MFIIERIRFLNAEQMGDALINANVGPIGDRLDRLTTDLSAYETVVGNLPEELDAEQVAECREKIQRFERRYTAILTAAGGQALLGADPVLEKKRKDAYEVLRRIRMTLNARYDEHFAYQNVDPENGLESNANTEMGNERRRRSRKQKGGRRRKPKRSTRKRKQTRKHK